MSCKCVDCLASLHTPSCAFVPSRLRAIYFTTSDERQTFTGTGQNSILMLYSSPTWGGEFGIFPAALQAAFAEIHYYEDTYKLNFYADDVVSEKGDAVTEEIGGKQFFVRDAFREITFTKVRTNQEFVKFVEKLRCLSRLYAFLVDDAGIVWGLRSGQSYKPIRVLSATINAKTMFANSSSVHKHEIKFTFDAFSDGDLVAIVDTNVYNNFAIKNALDYIPPAPVFVRRPSPNTFVLYTPIAAGAGVFETYLDAASISLLNFVFYDQNLAITNGTFSYNALNGTITFTPSIGGNDAYFIEVVTPYPLGFDFDIKCLTTPQPS